METDRGPEPDQEEIKIVPILGDNGEPIGFSSNIPNH